MLQHQGNQQYTRCECHECTQARWRMQEGAGLGQQWQAAQGARGQTLGQQVTDQELQPLMGMKRPGD